MNTNGSWRTSAEPRQRSRLWATGTSPVVTSGWLGSIFGRRPAVRDDLLAVLVLSRRVRVDAAGLGAELDRRSDGLRALGVVAEHVAFGQEGVVEGFLQGPD